VIPNIAVERRHSDFALSQSRTSHEPSRGEKPPLRINSRSQSWRSLRRRDGRVSASAESSACRGWSRASRSLRMPPWGGFAILKGFDESKERGACNWRIVVSRIEILERLSYSGTKRELPGRFLLLYIAASISTRVALRFRPNMDEEKIYAKLHSIFRLIARDRPFGNDASSQRQGMQWSVQPVRCSARVFPGAMASRRGANESG
jgi:hypothetical protein